MPKIDENRDEEILDEEEVEEENDAAEDEEEDSDSADEKDEEETEEEDESEDDEKGGDEDEEEKDEKKNGDKKDIELPEKFRGKSTKQIIDMYTNLEGMIADKALKMAGDFLKKKGLKAVDEDKKENEEDEFDLGLTDEQINKMSPKDFGKHLNRKITEKATKIAQETLERSEEVRGNVKREIAEATKTHPHLKENKEYRDVVLSIIEAANAKGEVVTLKSACEKADRALGVKKEEKKEKKPLRTAVEKGEGGDESKPLSDEDKVLKGIVNAGKNNSFLGGLGV